MCPNPFNKGRSPGTLFHGSVKMHKTALPDHFLKHCFRFDNRLIEESLRFSENYQSHLYIYNSLRGRTLRGNKKLHVQHILILESSAPNYCTNASKGVQIKYAL